MSPGVYELKHKFDSTSDLITRPWMSMDIN